MGAIRIGLDAMGGDLAPSMVVAGALEAAARFPEVTFVLVGRTEEVREELSRHGVAPDRFTIHHASQTVDMGEKPAVALRTKKDSSMRVGVNLVKGGELDALVSAGNTGALMATAKYVLKTLPGIDRPAIAAVLPTMQGQALMLDLGANVNCTAAHLCQFALMGEIYATTVMHLANPRIGLLNIGQEEEKGHEVIREAGERLKQVSRFYRGYVEGTGLYRGEMDVVVCDGFVGNVSLKSSEGVVQMFAHFLKASFSRSWYTRLAYLVARPALRPFRDQLDHRRHNGAILLGLNGVVVKSHGSADGYAFFNAVQAAIHLVRNQVNERIRDAVVGLPAAEPVAPPSTESPEVGV